MIIDFFWLAVYLAGYVACYGRAPQRLKGLLYIATESMRCCGRFLHHSNGVDHNLDNLETLRSLKIFVMCPNQRHCSLTQSCIIHAMVQLMVGILQVSTPLDLYGCYNGVNGNLDILETLR